jgi:acetate kinase
VREIGSFAALGGPDAIVFTGGIGENDTATPEEVVDGCAWLGLRLDERRTATPKPKSVRTDLARQPWSFRTNEELEIAAQARNMMLRV